jgi:threonine dehydrogenase-like Zn-dependent dehydrogenase
MQARHIVFPRPFEVEAQGFDYDLDGLGPDEVAIRNEYTLISPGTELACLSGSESWARLPFVPGYAGCGRVLAVGEDVAHLSEGDRVFSYTKHASIDSGRVVVEPIPTRLRSDLACFARMAAVAITALRVSQAELGDYVAVIGLGLVGNLAAQLFALAGCETIGIDLSSRRCEVARRCGVPHVVDGSREDPQQAIQRITGGAMCGTVVEAIGSSPVIEGAGDLAGKLGEVILLGTPRSPHETDITPILQRVHRWSDGCLTFKGAHEWRYPVKRDEAGHVKHSIQRNVQILLRMIAQEMLQVEELVTHILAPEEGEAAYRGLRESKDEYLGVLFDWGD